MLSPLAAATLPMSLGLQGGGLLFDGIGQAQGNRAMAEEANRQTAEWEAENAVQQAAMEKELTRRKAGLMSNRMGVNLATRQAAVQGAGTMAKGMGVGAADAARTSGSLLPVSVQAAEGAAGATRSSQDRIGMGEMTNTMRQSQLNQHDRARMYDQLLRQAGQKGHWWRQGGQLMQQTGHVLGSLGMGPMGAGMSGSGQPIMPSSVSNANIDADTPVDLPLYYTR